MTGDRLNEYLDDLRARLRGMPSAEVEEIVAELRSHVRESLEERHGAGAPAAAGDSVEAVLGRLGAPEELAALYRTDRMLDRALDHGKQGWLPLRLVAGMVRWAMVSVAGCFALVLLVAGYWTAVSFCIAAVTKLFAPGRVGLFRLPGGEYSLHLGFVAGKPPQGDEMLGFWIIPLGLVAGGLVYWATTHLVRACVGRWRRRPPTAAARSVTSTRTLRGWTQSAWFTALELAAVVALYIADARHLVPFSNTPFLLLLGWLSLRLRGLRWRDVGLRRPDNWSRMLLVGIAAGLAMESFAILVTEPFIARVFGHHPDLSDFKFLVGNLKALLLLQRLNWSLAAFGEEMVYRGYLLGRVTGILSWFRRNTDASGASSGAPRLAWAGALVVVSLLFGWAHAEGQGLPGMAQEGFNGLLLGVLYLTNGRRLGVPILAHGVSNTLAFVLIYLGRYPGVS